MLVPARTLLGVSAESAGQALASGAGAEAKPFGYTIVYANGRVDRQHACRVVRCDHREEGVLEHIALDVAGTAAPAPASVPRLNPGPESSHPIHVDTVGA